MNEEIIIDLDPNAIAACPFCGSVADIEYDSHRKWGKEFVSVIVRCQNNSCKGEAGFQMREIKEDHMKEIFTDLMGKAIRAWNCRVPQSPC